MTDAGRILAEEIQREGPIPFRRFMEVALYHPKFGYYTRGKDPFGRAGDFYTAEQIQPVFGILMARYIRSLFDEMGGGTGVVVELGAGRQEMKLFLPDLEYIPIEAGKGAMPVRFSGVVFANEFFDALPVDVAVLRKGQYRQMLVDFDGSGFVWRDGSVVKPEVREYLHRFAAAEEEGCIREVHLESLAWVGKISAALEHGFLIVIDYGYTRRELVRFPRGTLMSYRRHVASEDVLQDPGERDITSHVLFTAIEEAAAAKGFHTAAFESLSRTLLRAGEADRFASVLEGVSESEQLRRRLQLKTLLFGMGETFRTLVLGRAQNKSGPDSPGPL
ncbi:MAG: SAM-dependent methyltransferase [Bryobacteraceae bacterium]|nr:SAM-dependent methyltransferase [Bryobacterales bacterium]MEB2363680.1 SAM-dependent methyltransferase [Bryobacterales bacterium]NUM99526.1 SAM-dependent methyltransferase [Bryobacteraceae bacterium]